MKKFMFVAIMLIILSMMNCSTVEPGEVGIKVVYYGSDKGVAKKPLDTGNNTPFINIK